METWKPIETFPRYEVSNLGLVRSWRGRLGVMRAEPTVLRPAKPVGGYHGVSLCRERERRNFHVHRLVAEAFVPRSSPCSDVVNHLDGDKTNNVEHNLEWTTSGGNMAHALRTSLVNNHGSRNGYAKLTEDTVAEIVQLLAQGHLTGREIASRFNVTPANISSIATGKSWPTVPRPEGHALSRYWGGTKSWLSR